MERVWGERGGEQRVSNLVTSSRLFASTRVYSHLNRQQLEKNNQKKEKENKRSSIFSASSSSFFFSSWIFYTFAQLELCGGLTPISERSARVSCDDADSTQVSLLLAEADEPIANSNAFDPEDNIVARLCYAPTVCRMTTRSLPFLLAWHFRSPRVACVAHRANVMRSTLK